MRDILAGQPVRFEVTGTRKDGTLFDAEVSGMPVTYRGQPHVLYAARDITERRAAEAERERLEAQLRQAQKMEAIGQLTGGIAHDFNNILTSVIGYLVLGQERADALGDARLQRQLGQAHLAAQRARELIAQMLAFARRQRGERRTLALAPLVRPDAATAARHAAVVGVGGLRRAARVRRRRAAVWTPTRCSWNRCCSTCASTRATPSPGRARSVCAWAATAAVVPARRAARSVGTGRWVELSVADSGSGIAPELIERIFEPFTSSKEVGRGSGMGLAMVHGIVHDHGGHVLVETTPGAGSVFRVLLPPASGAAADAPPRTGRGGGQRSRCARA